MRINSQQRRFLVAHCRTACSWRTPEDDGKYDAAPPAGYRISWGGQLISAANRFKIVVPIALLSIFLLLFMTFRTVKDALLVFSRVLLGLTGGIAALCFTGIPLSISAGVGFIALSGVAVLNGTVMISLINMLRAEGSALDEAASPPCLLGLISLTLGCSLGFKFSSTVANHMAPE